MGSGLAFCILRTFRGVRGSCGMGCFEGASCTQLSFKRPWPVIGVSPRKNLKEIYEGVELDEENEKEFVDWFEKYFPAK